MSWVKQTCLTGSVLGAPRFPADFHMLPRVGACSAAGVCDVKRSPWNQTFSRSQIGQRSLLIALGRECQLNYFSRSRKWLLENLLDTYAMRVVSRVSRVNKQRVQQDWWLVLTGRLWFKAHRENIKSALIKAGLLCAAEIGFLISEKNLDPRQHWSMHRGLFSLSPCQWLVKPTGTIYQTVYLFI